MSTYRTLSALVLAGVLAVTGASTPAAVAETAAAPAVAPPTAPAAKPYLGWTSWSMQSSKYPGLNPRGDYSWLHEANVLKQADAMAAKLKPYGYRYINIDAGWWMNWEWKQGYDGNGRPAADKEKFPRGMKYVADYIHRKGLKAGIYLPVGLEKAAYEKGDLPIAGAPECSLHDIVYPDLRTTNGWDSSYKIDFAKPCAQAYIDSLARQIADWGYDFLKLDGVGPGSGKSGPNYDNRTDVAAFSAAIAKTGRPIHFELSWSLDIKYVEDWKRHSNGWRIDTDVECYCDTLVTWTNSVDNRFADAPAWAAHSGPGGWNDLDSVNVGNGNMDGLTKAERQSYMTLWAISASPLYIGDDLTKLDSYGLSLLTNREVIAVDQQGLPATPVRSGVNQQVWRVRNTDGSYTVALFNLDGVARPVTALWSEVGFDGKASVRDLWQRRDLGTFDGSYTATLPAHGSRLFTVKPRGAKTVIEAEAAANTLAGGASVGNCRACSGGRKVGNVGGTGTLVINGVTAAKAGERDLTIGYVDGSDGRWATMSVNGEPGTTVKFVGSRDGNWDLLQAITVRVKLRAGANTITFSAPGGYAPDIDSVTF